MNAKRWVYFISDDHGHIKIGVSADPEVRLSQLQTATPHRLRLLLKRHGNEDDEEYLHGIFHDDRLVGEWFTATRNLISFICFARLALMPDSVEEIVMDWWDIEAAEEETKGFMYDQNEWAKAAQVAR